MELQPNLQNHTKPVNMYSKTIKVIKQKKKKKTKSKENDHKVGFFNQTVERSSSATVNSAGIKNEGGR